MKIITEAPVFVPKQGASGYNNIGTDQDWLSADGDEFIPFDGIGVENMTGYRTADGDYFSANGEDFYNAEGEKVKGEGLKNFLKKVAGGIGKGVKKVGKGIKKGAQAIGKFFKNIKAKRKERRAEKEKNIPEVKSKPSPNAKPLGVLAPTGASTTAKPQFVSFLPPATSTTKPDNYVMVDGKKYDGTKVPKGAEIIVATDPSGNKTVGVSVPEENVVANKAPDGKYDYYVATDVGSNQEPISAKASDGSKKTNWLLIGGVVLAVGIAGYFLLKKK